MSYVRSNEQCIVIIRTVFKCIIELKLFNFSLAHVDSVRKGVSCSNEKIWCETKRIAAFAVTDTWQVSQFNPFPIREYSAERLFQSKTANA